MTAPDSISTAGLAAALAAAQAAFPAISRDREVTVQTKAGGSYKFKYAPLDSILAAVREPLASNGLALAQLLDSDPDGQPVLVTTLLHSGGASLSGRTPIPQAEGIQAFGSAVTYLRRYSIQAILGIAAEEDDDGNHAAGNSATFAARARNVTPPAADRNPDGSLIGTAEIGGGSSDFLPRPGPRGSVLSFRLRSGRQTYKVVAEGDLAEDLAVSRDDLLGKTVTCWGRITVESFTPAGKDRAIEYQVLTLERLSAGDLLLPAEDRSAPSEPLFAEGELEAVMAKIP